MSKETASNYKQQNGTHGNRIVNELTTEPLISKRFTVDFSIDNYTILGRHYPYQGPYVTTD